MPTTTERFETVADGFGALVANCPADRWDDPSPCPPWSAREVVDHVVDGFSLALAAADVPLALDDADADADADVAERWRAARAAVVAAMEDPAVASRMIPSPVGTLAFKQVAGGVLLHDLLAHSWDLARATGQDERLDPESVDSALAKMTPFDELLRGPGMFGPRVQPPPGADAQTELLCFLGRRP